MNPFTLVSTAALQLIARAIELRLEHYKVNPKLREQDAENAEIWGRWGNQVLKVLDRLFGELGLDEEPPPS